MNTKYVVAGEAPATTKYNQNINFIANWMIR